MFDNPMREAIPPRDNGYDSAKRSLDDRKEMFGRLLETLVGVAPDADKPVLEVLTNRNRVNDLAQKLVSFVQCELQNDDKDIPRERAKRVNAVFADVIETLEKFINENV